MGWLILYSFLYFLSLDFMGLPPGKEVTTFQKVFNFAVVPMSSIPIWLLTWRKFATAFKPKAPRPVAGGMEYSFALRNPALKYYLMVLKLFLMVMGANGIIALDHYEGGTRVFYICNFAILYLYAPAFFLINLSKLIKGSTTRLLLNDQHLRLTRKGKIITEIKIESIQKILVQEDILGMLIQTANANLYLGGPKAKVTPFYLSGIEELVDTLKRGGTPIQNTSSIKEEVQKTSVKPAVYRPPFQSPILKPY